MYRSPREVGSWLRFFTNASTEFLAKSSRVLPLGARRFIDIEVSIKNKTIGMMNYFQIFSANLFFQLKRVA
jgi:hypothetical protein